MIVTEFEIDDALFDDPMLKVKRFVGYTSEWAEFILKNRSNSERRQLHDYDIVIGPIADDKVGAQIRRLENGDITLHEFLKRIKYMKGVTFQYFFGTEKAVALLNKI